MGVLVWRHTNSFKLRMKYLAPLFTVLCLVVVAQAKYAAKTCSKGLEDCGKNHCCVKASADATTGTCQPYKAPGKSCQDSSNNVMWPDLVRGLVDDCPCHLDHYCKEGTCIKQPPRPNFPHPKGKKKHGRNHGN